MKYVLTPISDLFDVTSSKRVFQSEWTKSGTPFYRAREIVRLSKDGFVENELFISNEMYETYSRKYGVPKYGDILITGVGTLGICYKVKENDKFYFKDGNIIWLKKKAEVNTDFIEFAFQSDFVKKQIERNANGATVGTYTITDANKTLIPLPPLSEQKRIAELLDAADNLRKKDKALLEKYDQLAQSLFLEMFGDPVKNEKGWEKLEFGMTVKNLDSQRIPVKSSDRTERTGRFPYYGASGIIDYVDDYIFDGSFLLIGEDGNNLVSRSTPIAFLVNGKCWVNNHAHILESTVKSNLTYLKFYINNIDLKPYISGSAQPKLNRKNLDGILINLPPIELQNQFAEQVQLIEKQKEIAKQNLEKSEELMKGLMGRVFG